MKPLNNLVSELLCAPVLESTATAEYTFTNPRDGWVLFRVELDAGSKETPAFAVDGGASADFSLVVRPVGVRMFEAMRFLSSGRHTVSIMVNLSAGGSLAVRSIPELVYSNYGAGPQVTEQGSFDLPFLEPHVLPHVNCMVGREPALDRAFRERWKSEGKRLLIETYAKPYFEKLPADQSLQYWKEAFGTTTPMADGLIADEFFRSDEPSYDAITESVRQLRSSPGFGDRLFYPYCAGPVHEGSTSRAFLESIMDGGSNFAWEQYLSDRPTQEEAGAFLRNELVNVVETYTERIPKTVEHLIVCFGHLITAPPENLITLPSVDHKYYMDMQFNLLANDPAYKGLYGIMEYLSSYADEECLRWAMRLYRHYGIEGRKEMLSDAYGFTYAPGHVLNPDFEREGEGWTLEPAERGSISFGRHEGYSWLQGRYPRTSAGDTFLIAKYSAKGPNQFSQNLRGLKPGVLYSVKLYASDYDDLLSETSERRAMPVDIRIDNAEIIQEKCFDHVFPNCYSHELGKFNRQHPYWITYYRRVFRARSEQTLLTISDRSPSSQEVDRIGRRLACNFIAVQPYFDK